MSCRPHAFGGNVPTASVFSYAAPLSTSMAERLSMFACAVVIRAPVPYGVDVPARHAYSHSLSVGSRNSIAVVPALRRERKALTS